MWKGKKEGRSQRHTLTEYFITHHHSDTLPPLPASPIPLAILAPSLSHATPTPLFLHLFLSSLLLFWLPLVIFLPHHCTTTKAPVKLNTSSRTNRKRMMDLAPGSDV